MKLERLVLKDILRFRGETVIDFSALPPGLIALVGPNGAGKTSLLETVPGTIYRKLPSRRDGADPAVYARSRAAALDVIFTVDDAMFHARVSVDGQTRASEAVLEQRVDADLLSRWAPLNDGKVSSYKRVIQERFPSLELFLTSAFAPQGKGDRLAKMTPGEGQDLFAEFLGLQRYAAMSATAKQAALHLASARDRLLAAAAMLDRDTGPAIAAELERLADDLQTRGGDAEVLQREAAARIRELEARLAIVSDQAAAYAAATQRIRTLEGHRGMRQAERAQLDVSRTGAGQAIARERAAIEKDRDAALEQLAARIRNNEQLRARASEIRQAVRDLQETAEELAKLRQTLEGAHATVASLQHDDQAAATAEAAASTAKGALDRATRAITILSTVPCGGSSPYDSCQFLKDAAAAKAQIPDYEATAAPLAELQARREQLRRSYDAARELETSIQRRIKMHETALASHQKTAGYAEQLAASDARIVELEQQVTTTRETAAAALTQADERHTARMAELDYRADELDAILAQLERELETALQDLRATETGNAEAVTLTAQIQAARDHQSVALTTLGQVEAVRGELDRRRRLFDAKRAERVTLGGKLATLETELFEWQSLASIFSRDGLPDLEIDAAGPTISATTNEILTHCFGPRFTVEIVTQVARAGGKGPKDEFAIRVLDNEEGGDWRDLSDLSGGEKVIVCEALMNAIAVYVNTRSLTPIRTLWRDETGSALDPANAVRYVEMLRKVRELGGIHHVLFISHNADAAALADAQIRVADGRATVVLPPFNVQEAA